MATRRFTDDLPDPPSSPKPSTPAQPVAPQPVAEARPTSPSRPAAAPATATTAGGPGGAHLPRTLTQVMNEANEKVVRGDLVDYVPLPTGFDPLDGFIGG